MTSYEQYDLLFDVLTDKPGGKFFDFSAPKMPLSLLIEAIRSTTVEQFWTAEEKVEKIAVLSELAMQRWREADKALVRVMENRSKALNSIRELAERIVDECEEVGADGSADIL